MLSSRYTEALVLLCTSVRLSRTAGWIVGTRMIEHNLGTSLRGLREQQGMSLRALAERVDFSASFLSQIENGQCSPSISSMEKIANALGVTLGQFFLSANQHVVNIVRASERDHMALDWSRAEIASLGTLSNASQFRASCSSSSRVALRESTPRLPSRTNLRWSLKAK